jgi:UDP-2,3-diacylglucosamine pyrophosphatase LpxH
MSNPLLIISDVHYGGFGVKKNNAISADFEQVLLHYSSDPKTELIVAGDLFDYWMEYPGGVTPAFGFPLLASISKTFGNRCHFIPGNHDVWEHGFFSRFGIMNAGPRLSFDFFGLTLEIFHGDGHDGGPVPLPLPLLNRFIRNPVFVTWFQRFFPPFAGWFVMKWFSRLNHLKELFERNKKDRVEQAVAILQNEEQPLLIVCGHEHKAKLTRYKKTGYLNTGNFSTDRTFAYLSDKDISLLRWNATANSPETILRLTLHEFQHAQ